MGAAFVALQRGRGQGGFEGASLNGAVTEKPTQLAHPPTPTSPSASSAPGPFPVQPGGLQGIGLSFGVARSGKTHTGIASSLAP
jgi:hypothetical protein